MQPRWKDGSKSMMTVNAIFAGFSGVLLVNLILLPESSPAPVLLIGSVVPLALAIGALLSFVLAAELITDALDENKVLKYILSMEIYNLGVLCVFWSLAAFLFIRGHSYLSLAPVAVSLYWLKHLLELALSKKERDEYVATISNVDG